MSHRDNDTELSRPSHRNELRDHRHLLSTLQSTHARSLTAGLLSTLARPSISSPKRKDEDHDTEDDFKGELDRMDVDSDDDLDLKSSDMQIPAHLSSSSSSSVRPLEKVHPHSNFTLFPVHVSQLPHPPAFTLPDEILALSNSYLRTLDPPSEVHPAHGPALVASSLAFLDGALLAVADATSSVGGYSERERGRQRTREREREEGGWVRVVQALGGMEVPELVKEQTLRRLQAVYGPSPSLECAYLFSSPLLVSAILAVAVSNKRAEN